MGSIAALAVVGAVWAILSSLEANRQRKTADEQRTIATTQSEQRLQQLREASAARS